MPLGPEEIREDLDAVSRIAFAQSAAANWNLKLASIVGTFFLPVVIGAVLELRSTIFASDNAFLITLGVLVLLQIALATIIVSTTASLTSVYGHVRRIHDGFLQQWEQNSSMAYWLQHLSLITQSNYFSLSQTPVFLKGIREEEERISEYIDEICDYIIEERDYLFGFQKREGWNFCVYLFSESSNELIPVWRRSAVSIWDGERATRAFPPGTGHVGTSFKNCNEIITGDALAPDVAALIDPPTGLHDNKDSEKYKSFASIPIGPTASDMSPLGVLVATSDQENRFSVENCLSLRNTAKFLALLCDGLTGDAAERNALPYRSVRHALAPDVGSVHVHAAQPSDEEND